MENWLIHMKKDDFKGIGNEFGIDPVIARVIRNRDVEGLSNVGLYLNGTLSDMHAPSLMKGMRAAAELMASKIKEGKRIRVIADYDVDGVMSCYILFMGLKMAGADVSYDIPDRIKDGYGMNLRLVDDAKRDGADTIITCDNGIAAEDAVRHAKEMGMTVIITDHHEPQATLPTADVIVDPKQEGDTYPFREICGAMVALKFIYELYDVMDIDSEPDLFIEYAALATVCDIMPLQDENRILVREGLKKMKQTDNPGLRRLIEVSGIDDSRDYKVYYFSFVIGPSINTIGRLESALTAMELLTSGDETKINAIATHMYELNEERKRMTEEGASLASEMIEAYRAETPEEKWDDVLVIYLEGIHESIAGIIAGRIMDKYHRPTIIFADSLGNPDIYKGSARSLGSYNIFEELTKVNELLAKYGGHEKAAGLSVRKENLELLRRKLNENALLTEEDKNPPYYIDVPMPFGYVNEKIIEELKVIEPCGMGNPSPVFAEAGMRVLSARILGKNRNVLKLICMDKNRKRYNVIGFDPDSFVNDIKKWFDEEECVKMLKGDISRVVLDIAYFPEINEFNGVRSIDYKLLRYKKGAPIL